QSAAMFILDADGIASPERAFDAHDSAGEQAGTISQRAGAAGIDYQLASHAHAPTEPGLARTILAARQEQRPAIFAERLAYRGIIGAIDYSERYPRSFGNSRRLKLRNHPARSHARARTR